MRVISLMVLLALPIAAQPAAAVLSAAEIEQLEATLARNPADRAAQTQLGRNYAFAILGITALGQYDRVAGMDAAKASSALAQHARDQMRTATIPGLLAESGKALWNYSTDAQSYSFLHGGNRNASFDPEKAFAVNTLDRAIDLDPTTPDWRSSRIPITVFRTNFENVLPLSPSQALVVVKDDLARLTGSSRAYSLADAAKLAVRASALDDAAGFADELIASAAKDWNYGNAVYFGNMVLGQVALRRGDMTATVDRLLASGRTPGSPQLNSFGPNLTLVRELLTGEFAVTASNRVRPAARRHIAAPNVQQAVLDFFDLCQVFWKMGGDRLRQWSDQVRAGDLPDFGANLIY